MAKATTKTANKTRAAKAKAVHEKKTKERTATIKSLQAQYASEKDNPVLKDILTKCQKYIDYHNKIAQDGVGARKTGHKLVDGSEEIETIYLTNNQRAGHLDKSAGIQEIVDYIDRQINPPTPVKKTSKTAK